MARYRGDAKAQQCSGIRPNAGESRSYEAKSRDHWVGLLGPGGAHASWSGYDRVKGMPQSD